MQGSSQGLFRILSNIQVRVLEEIVNGVVRQVFVKYSMFLMSNVWHGYICLQFLESLKLNRPINIEYQHKSKSVTKSYAPFTQIDHKYELCSNKVYNQKLYHFSGFTKNDVNLVKLMFQLYSPKVIVIFHVMSHFMSIFHV